MSPRAGEVLTEVIQPMLAATVPQVVKTTGAEDHAELVQDGMVMAAQAIELRQLRGQPIWALNGQGSVCARVSESALKP